MLIWEQAVIRKQCSEQGQQFGHDLLSRIHSMPDPVVVEATLGFWANKNIM